MKFTKFLTFMTLVFMLTFAGFAQDSSKTEAPKPEKKHMVMKNKGTKTMKVKLTKKHNWKTKKASSKKAESDTTSKPAGKLEK